MAWEDPSVKKGIATFKAALAETIIAWNLLEGTARYLTETLAGSTGPGTQGLIAHIPNQTLANTMQALSHAIDELTVSHVAHFCMAFGRLGSWRNYYVHGIQGFALTDGKPVGFINEVDTKSKKLTAHEAYVTTEELCAVGNQMREYRSYAGPIIAHIFDSRGQNLFAASPLASLEKPALPDQPSRDRIHLLSRPPQPQS